MGSKLATGVPDPGPGVGVAPGVETTTCWDTVFLPLLFVAVSRTVFVPVDVYMCGCGVCIFEDVPSPNSQNQLVGLLVADPVNWYVYGVLPVTC